MSDEVKEKCFNFTVESTVANYGYVVAKDIEEARALIEAEEWIDLDDSEVIKFGKITDLKEEA